MLPSLTTAQITRTTYLPWRAWGTTAEGAAAGILGDSRGIPSPLHPRDFPQQRPPHGKSGIPCNKRTLHHHDFWNAMIIWCRMMNWEGCERNRS